VKLFKVETNYYYYFFLNKQKFFIFFNQILIHSIDIQGVRRRQIEKSTTGRSQEIVCEYVCASV
jgi:hypothetical protein